MAYPDKNGTTAQADGLLDSILRLSNSASPRVDFLSLVSQLLIESLGCGAVEIWVRDEGVWARSCLHRHGVFDFELRPLASADDNGLEAVRVALGLGPVIEQRCEGVSGPRSEQETGRLFVSTELGHPGAVIALIVASEPVGWLALRAPDREALSMDFLRRSCRVAETLSIAVVNERAQAALRERVKELTCLYRLSQLAEDPAISLDHLLEGTSRLLPPAWQYPEITIGRVVLDGKIYGTAKEHRACGRQRAEIVVNRERRGWVEVVYTENRPPLDEGPFLKEERSLLNAIAREVAAVIERRQASEERARLRTQLRHADRLATIGQLAAGVAHELNEPLGAILGFSQLVKKTPDLDDQVVSDLAKIETSALHAREIVRKLMFFARQAPPQTTRVDLNQVVEEGLRFLEARLANAGIELERNLAKELPPIGADSSQLQQVLVNLVVNAIHAMPDGGRLIVATEEHRGSVMLRVVDTGTGMSEEVRRQIFMPFFTTKDVDKGTGLGLAVVHGIVTSHGGSIRVKTREGEGACFEIELPIG